MIGVAVTASLPTRRQSAPRLLPTAEHDAPGLGQRLKQWVIGRPGGGGPEHQLSWG